METLTTDKVNQIISDLEKLKGRIASIESQYNILNENYTQLCEDAISLLIARNQLKEKNSHKNIQHSKAADIPEIKNAPHKKKTTPDKVIDIPQNIEEIKESVLKSAVLMDELDIKHIPEQSLEDIIVFQYKQNTRTKTAASKRKKRRTASSKIITQRDKAKPVVEVKYDPKKGVAQSIIDTIGDGIETGLDKIGDGLIYPFAKIAELSHKLSSGPENK